MGSRVLAGWADADRGPQGPGLVWVGSPTPGGNQERRGLERQCESVAEEGCQGPNWVRSWGSESRADLNLRPRENRSNCPAVSFVIKVVSWHLTQNRKQTSGGVRSIRVVTRCLLISGPSPVLRSYK